MAENLFKILGAKSIASDLDKLSKGTQRTIVRPALTAGARIIGMSMRSIVTVRKGFLKKSIKWKVYTWRGKGGKQLVAKIGTIGDSVNNKDEKGTPIFKYAGSAIRKNDHLTKAVKATENAATQMLLKRTDIELRKFHSKGGR
jgi:hypothetical protein